MQPKRLRRTKDTTSLLRRQLRSLLAKSTIRCAESGVLRDVESRLLLISSLLRAKRIGEAGGLVRLEDTRGRVGKGRAGLGAVDDLLLVVLLLREALLCVASGLRVEALVEVLLSREAGGLHLHLLLLAELALGLKVEASGLRLQGRVVLLYGLDAG